MPHTYVCGKGSAAGLHWRRRPPVKPACRGTRVRAHPQLAPRPQMHWPRQGCTSLGSTETLLCSGSWSPDALIETLRPCRNQREGKGSGEGRKTHLASAKTLLTTLISWGDKCTSHIETYSEMQSLFSVCCDTENTHTHTHPNVCILHQQMRCNYLSSRTRRHNNCPAGRTVTPEYTSVLFIELSQKSIVDV